MNRFVVWYPNSESEAKESCGGKATSNWFVQYSELNPNDVGGSTTRLEKKFGELADEHNWEEGTYIVSYSVDIDSSYDDRALFHGNSQLTVIEYKKNPNTQQKVISTQFS